MVAAPLLLLGTPGLAAALGARARAGCSHTVRTLARFIPALLIFNLVLVFTHWPLMVNESLHSGVVHFSLHAVLFVSSLIVWLPIVSPLPEIPRLAPVAADALPVRVVGGADGSGVVPHLRLVAAVQVLRARAAPLRAVDARRPADSPG